MTKKATSMKSNAAKHDLKEATVMASASTTSISDVMTGNGVDGQVPLNLLRRSESNVRKNRTEKDLKSIPELAALIRAHGLFMRLFVVEGADGFYDVVAGGRRLEALQMLASQGHLKLDQLIDCRLFPTEEAVQISTAENSGREEMHPADQFEAFRQMIEVEGASLEDVAARYKVSTLTVRRRMKLAKVAPELLALFCEGKIAQEQLQVLAALDDKATQLHVWNTSPTWQRSAYHLRSLVTAQELAASHPIVRYLGLQAYTAAGGAVRSDLFASEEGEDTFLSDPALVKRLATEKLERHSEELRLAEGWAWVMPMLTFTSMDERTFGKRTPTKRKPTKAEAKELKDLQDQLEKVNEEIEAEYENADEEEGADEDIIRNLEGKAERLDAAILVHAERLEEFSEAARAKSGVVVTLDSEGGLRHVRGLVKADDANREQQQRRQSAAEGDGADGDNEAERLHMPSASTNGRKARSEFPERVVMDLTAHRTAAVQASMIEQPRIALVALVSRLADCVFAHSYNSSPVTITLTQSSYNINKAASGFAESRAGKALAQAEAHWREMIPATNWEAKGLLFAWLMEQDDTLLLSLLAFLTAQSIDLMASTLEASTRSDALLADALGVDMADWWTPQASNYFTHLPKQKAVEAVAQACGQEVAAPLAKMKKDEAAVAAEAALTGKRWLPAPLIVTPASAAQDEHEEEDHADAQPAVESNDTQSVDDVAEVTTA